MLPQNIHPHSSYNHTQFAIAESYQWVVLFVCVDILLLLIALRDLKPVQFTFKKDHVLLLVYEWAYLRSGHSHVCFNKDLSTVPRSLLWVLQKQQSLLYLQPRPLHRIINTPPWFWFLKHDFDPPSLVRVSIGFIESNGQHLKSCLPAFVSQ